MNLGPQEERTLILKTQSAAKLSINNFIFFQIISLGQPLLQGDFASGTYQSQVPYQFNTMGGAYQRSGLSYQSLHQTVNQNQVDGRGTFTRGTPGLGVINEGFGGQNKNTGVGLSSIGQNVSQYHVQKFQDEIKHLKLIIDRLASKLKDYQQQFSIPQGDFQNIFVQDSSQAEKESFFAIIGDQYTSMLSSHLLGPLFLEYESKIQILSRDLKVSKMEVQRQAEDIGMLVKENEDLATRLEVQQREYLKIVEETRDNADILAMKSGQSFKGRLDGAVQEDRQEMFDEVKELRDRMHMLTEENQVLFEQITLLRSHYDKYNDETSQKLSDAQQKSEAYDLLHHDFQMTLNEKEDFQRAAAFLEKTLTERSQILGIIEEERRQDQLEMKKMREQLQIFQQEYVFYKTNSERLEFKQQEEMESLSMQIRELLERDKDMRAKIDDQERENSDLSLHNRSLMADLQRLQRDLRQIISVNDEFQLQSQQFKERELQFNELAREYREKIKIIEFDREKLAIKEEQFKRLVMKSQNESKQDLKRQQEKYESMLHSRARDNDRKIEELEDKLNRNQDECDDYKRKCERVDKVSYEQKRQIDDFSRKEDKSCEQAMKIVEQLKNEIKEKERDQNNYEVKEAYAKQDLVKTNKESTENLQLTSAKLEKMEKELDDKSREVQRLRDETNVLKATLKEADRGRDSMIKEISNSKDAQHDRIRDIEKHKEAEIKVLEKILENMKADKRDVEDRYEEMITKYEIINSKNAEEHHNTVKYFENVVSQYKQQLNKFSYPEREKLQQVQREE